MNQDWAFLQAAMEDLEEYLSSPVLHWPLNQRKAKRNGLNLPRLTLGNLCLAKARLLVLPEFKDLPDFLHACEWLDQIRDQWRANWSRKAEREFSERLRLWRAFVTDELVVEQSTSDYRNQVRLRTMLELLIDELLNENLAQRNLMQSLDQLVMDFTLPGPFIWDVKFQQAFPENRFWFLYRT